MTSSAASVRTLAERRSSARNGVGERMKGRAARMSFAAVPRAALSRGLTAGSVAIRQRIVRSVSFASHRRAYPWAVPAPLAEQRLPLRTLVTAAAAPDRILHHGLWFKGHNNPRYAELLPRLERLDPVVILVSGR